MKKATSKRILSASKREITDEILAKWQGIVDLMAEIIGVPAGFIMKIDPPQIEVFIASSAGSNPYKKGERADLNTGLYCETVMAQRSRLLVPDALKDPKWDHNPDIKLGMISYLGFPLLWPDGEVFGTICVLDVKENRYSDTYEKLISRFKDLIEADLTFLYQSQELEEEITERKQLFKILKESEQKYRSLFENMLNGFAYCQILVDENNKPIDFVYLEVNDAFERLTGLKKEDVIEKKVTEVVPGTKESHPELFSIYGKVALTGEPTKFDIYFEPLGLWLTISVYSPQKGYFVAVFENITERKQAEEDLKRSEERLRILFEYAPDGIYLNDLKGNFVDSNKAAEEIVGYEKDELVGKNFLKLKLLSPGQMPKAVASLAKNVLGQPTGPDEFVLNRKDGSQVSVEIRSFPVKIRGEALVLAIARDITERKEAENELQRAHDGLEKRVNERTAELTRATQKLRGEITERKRAEKQLKVSLREKEVLLEEIHHRVRNNLQVISSLLDMTSLRIHDKRSVGLLQDVQTKIYAMALIHSELYESERLDQIEMGRQVKALVTYLSQMYPVKIKITTVVEASGVYLSLVQATPCALILSELITNSFKHAFKEREKGTIEISLRQSKEGAISLRVKDDGIGIPDEVDFYKTESLGLKLVKNLVEKQLKGKIRVNRTNGTEFNVEFKVSK